MTTPNTERDVGGFAGLAYPHRAHSEYWLGAAAGWVTTPRVGVSDM
jgi:hypothetical protein